MIRAKIFRDDKNIYTLCDESAEEKVNEFLEKNEGKIEVVDVSLATNTNLDIFSKVNNSILLVYNTLDDELDEDYELNEDYE